MRRRLPCEVVAVAPQRSRGPCRVPSSDKAFQSTVNSARMAETGTRTVERALTLLSAVAQGGGTLSQLARTAELSPSTASRLLGPLAAQEFVRRDEHGRYHAGSRLRQLAAASLRQDPLHELAGPHLAALAAETGETANL